MRLNLRTVLVSAAAAVIGAVVYSIIFGDGVTMDLGADQTSLDTMTHADAMSYIERNTRPVSGWQSFLISAPHLLYWKGIGQLALAMFAVSIAAIWAAGTSAKKEGRSAT